MAIIRKHATMSDVEKALRLVEVEKIDPKDVARIMGFKRTTIYNWIKKYKEGGFPDLILVRPVLVPDPPSQVEELNARIAKLTAVIRAMLDI